jgi:hypothetical protein
VELPSFLPDLKAYSGRALQLPGSSWLGPCFSVSVLPDPLIKQAPDILAECFGNPEQRRQVRRGWCHAAPASVRAPAGRVLAAGPLCDDAAQP